MKRWFAFIGLFFIFFVMFTSVAASESNYFTDRFLVCFHKSLSHIEPRIENGTVQVGIPSFDRLCRRFGVVRMERWLTSADERDVDGEIKLSNIYRLVLSDKSRLEEALKAFAEVEDIIRVEREFYDTPDVFLDPYQPNDPSLSSQWYIFKIMADYAWGLWTNFGQVPADTTVVVAVVDMGIEWTHPDLIDNIWVNPGEDIDGDGVVGDFGPPSSGGDEDGIDNDGNGKVDDLIGWDFAGADHNFVQPDNNPLAVANDHGTNVMGCASAATDNNLGIAGTGFRVKILVTKHGADDGYQYLLNTYDGILYAAKSGADIINCSWGSYNYSGFAQSVINTAHDTYGAIIVGSAGNDNYNLANHPHYPSNYNHVICVAGTNPDDSKANGSNYGTRVDISAPYSSIYTTTFMGSGGYQTTQGTSFSAPIVSGVLALLKSMYPDSGQGWLENRLLDSADPIDDMNPNYVGMLGSGRVNAFNALGQPLYPNLNYNAQALQIINDDGNGVLNPGEGAYLRITIKNADGWALASNVEAVLRCSSPFITITDSVATFGSISGGSIGINITDPFEFYVDTLASNGDYPFTLYIKANEGSGVLYEKLLDFSIYINGFQTGWPVSGLSYVQSPPVVQDVDGDGSPEIFVGTNAGNLWGWKVDGSPLNGFPVALGGQIWGSPTLGDLNGDGTPEILVGNTAGHLFVVAPDGTILHDWDIGEFIYSTVSLADLDNNGAPEIIFGTFSGNLHVLNPDGSNFSAFPYAMGTMERVMGGCAVADLNGDGYREIVVTTQNKHIYAFDQNGNLVSGFPVTTNAPLFAAPVIADFSGNVRIIAGDAGGTVYLIKPDGSLEYSLDAGAPVRAPAGLCDVSSDGVPEIFVPTQSGEVAAWDWQGNSLSGFPIAFNGGAVTQPVFADVTGDGAPEMVLAALSGEIYTYNFSSASWVTGFPVTIGGQTKSTPTVVDLDGDGDLEIVTGTNNSVAVLDVRFPNADAESYWHTYQGNPAHTGYYGDALVGIPHGQESKILRYALFPNFPNPFNPSTTIRYSLQKTSLVRLEVYNVLGERVAVLVNQKQGAGLHRVQWDARHLPSGIYFCRLRAGEFQAVHRMLLMK